MKLHSLRFAPMLLLLLGCKQTSSPIDATKSSQESSAKLQKTDRERFESILDAFNVPPDERTALHHLSGLIKAQADTAADMIKTSIHVVRDGSADEKAGLLVSVLQTSTLAVLPLAVPALAIAHLDKTSEIESAMRKGLTNYFQQMKTSLARDFRENKFPPKIGPFKSVESLSKLLEVENKDDAQSLVALIPATNNEQSTLSLDESNTADCSPFSGNSMVRHCSKQEIGMKWMEMAKGGVWCVALLLIVSRALASLALLADISLFIYGAYLAWGLAIL
jgi:hypothetical protein